MSNLVVRIPNSTFYALHDENKECVASAVAISFLDRWWINTLFVPTKHRRRGHATKLVQLMVQDLSRLGTGHTYVNVNPMTDDAMSEEQLTIWYLNRGFRGCNDEFPGSRGIYLKHVPSISSPENP